MNKNYIFRKKKQSKNYLLNGAIYIFKSSLFKENLKIKRPYAFIMDSKKFVDIDNKFDFELARLIKKIYKMLKFFNPKLF